METIEYTLVGSGTVVPDADRGPAAHHFTCGDLAILCDLGSGTLRQLDALELSFVDLDLVAITHRHQDHTADLLPLLFALKNTPGVSREKPLSLLGYPGLGDDLRALALIYGDWVVEPGFQIETWEAAETPVELERETASVEVLARPVSHSPGAIGLRLTLIAGRKRAVVAYTGDSEPGPQLVELARGADLLIAECSVADEDKVSGHMTPRAVGRLAADADVARVVVTHLYPSALRLGQHEIERRIREAYSEGQVMIGYDGLEVGI